MDTGSQDEQKKLQELDDILRQGTEYVKEEGREVRYRSLEDLIRIRNLIIARLGQVRDKASFVPQFRKGL